MKNVGYLTVVSYIDRLLVQSVKEMSSLFINVKYHSQLLEASKMTLTPRLAFISKLQNPAILGGGDVLAHVDVRLISIMYL